MSAAQLESERLILRPWCEADFEPFAAYYAEEETARFVGGLCTRPQAWRRFAAMLGHWQLRGYGEWAVEIKASGAFAGAVGLLFPEGWPELELGYWLTLEQQGHGYATEAARTARQYAREVLGKQTLVSYIDPLNLPSIRVAERLGAVYEDTIALCGFGDHRVYRYA